MIEKREILDRVRNRLTYPRTLFQILLRQASEYQKAIQEIDELIKEIENNEITDQ